MILWRRLGHFVFQHNRVTRAVGRKHDLFLVSHKNRRIIIIKIVRQILERTGKETVDENIRLPVFKSGKQHHFPVIRIAP